MEVNGEFAIGMVLSNAPTRAFEAVSGRTIVHERENSLSENPCGAQLLWRLSRMVDGGDAPGVGLKIAFVRTSPSHAELEKVTLAIKALGRPFLVAGGTDQSRLPAAPAFRSRPGSQKWPISMVRSYTASCGPKELRKAGCTR